MEPPNLALAAALPHFPTPINIDPCMQYGYFVVLFERPNLSIQAIYLAIIGIG